MSRAGRNLPEPDRDPGHAGAPPPLWNLDPADDPTLPPLPALSHDERPRGEGVGQMVLLVALGLVAAVLLGLVAATEAGLLR
ncbi:hypothetical protein ACR9E3_24490 [Actinomycetospora sp. C-140]